MKTDKKRYFSDKAKYTINISILVFVFVVIIFAAWLSRHTIQGNVVRRVTTESEFLARQQAELINQTIEEQFNLIDTIGGMVENGISFYEKEDRVILKTFVDENDLGMLGYAEADGNVINYNGKIIGNISDSTYFQDVFTGKKDRVCQYLESTDFEGTPRILFATAVYRDGEIQGVVCYTKTVEVLKNNLFQQSMFEGNECAIIIDSEGNILAKNNRAEKKYAEAENLKDVSEAAEDILMDCRAMKNGSTLDEAEEESVFAYAPIKQNDWYLICSIDMMIASHEYASNQMAILRSIMALSFIFAFAILYFLMIVFIQIRNGNRAYREYRLRYERVLALLQKMKCMIIEYDIKTGKLKPNASFEETFGYGLTEDFLAQMQKQRIEHPEFNYEGLVGELNYAITHKVTTSFESMYCVDKTSYKIFSMVMIAVCSIDMYYIFFIGHVAAHGVFHRIGGDRIGTEVDAGIFHRVQIYCIF